MNKTERIPIDLNNPTQDKYVFFDLQQDVSAYEILTLKIDQKDFYQYFNADYGVLIGRVVANNNVGVPNAKISIFIPLTDADKHVGNIVSIYPYTTPRDLNQEGKRYNLLPRVATYNQQTGTYKPKQPFGSFPIKEEIVTNSNYLDVYKKYYKYTALTNENGDYMMFGVPRGTQTVHLSVDITDIGAYSMTPESMVINLGYSPFLFTNNNTKIKPSNDLTILPNIEVQEISIDVIPYWGDTENYTIGITRQDFRIRAEIKSSFIVFGTSMMFGEGSTIGDPDLSAQTPARNDGFYRYSDKQQNNFDIRVFRPSTFNLSVFSYTPNTPISDITGNSISNINYQTQIYQLSKTEYFEYNQNGDFVLSIPCNRRKVITDETGQQNVVGDNNPYGIFTEFYGMIIVEYPKLNLTVEYNHKFEDGPSIARVDYGRFKIPQSIGLKVENTLNETNNNTWRHEYQKFNAGKIYSVSQFLTTKYIDGVENNTDDVDNSNNRLDYSVNDIGGIYFKVAGTDEVTQTNIDNQNYLVNPATGTTYVYDFPDNGIDIGKPLTNRMFGAQWLNLCLVFPQFVWAGRGDAGRDQNVSDMLFYAGGGSRAEYTSTYFVGNDNTQPIFAGLTNTRGFISGFGYPTAFIELPSIEIAKLNLIPRKGINVTLFNDALHALYLDVNLYKYRPPANSVPDLHYNTTAWDSHASEYVSSTGSSYLFKGMYDNDCVKLLFDLNIL